MSRSLADRVFKSRPIPIDEAKRKFSKQEIAALERLFRSWHKKFPSGARNSSYEFPEYMVNVGKADHIVYYSDKWERDGKSFDYVHDFDSRPSVYFPAGFDAWGTKVATRIPLGSDPNKRVLLNFLAVVKELVLTNGHGDTVSIEIDDTESPLFGTHDSKGLVLLAKLQRTAFPVMIRGGRMSVTPSGIVH